jgi:hypothetical protein
LTAGFAGAALATVLAAGLETVFAAFADTFFFMLTTPDGAGCRMPDEVDV